MLYIITDINDRTIGAVLGPPTDFEKLYEEFRDSRIGKKPLQPEGRSRTSEEQTWYIAWKQKETALNKKEFITWLELKGYQKLDYEFISV